jgi:hypothetical protein
MSCASVLQRTVGLSRGSYSVLFQYKLYQGDAVMEEEWSRGQGSGCLWFVFLNYFYVLVLGRFRILLMLVRELIYFFKKEVGSRFFWKDFHCKKNI